MHIISDAKKKQHIIIATDDIFIHYYHELLGKPKIAASPTLTRITAVAYDSLSGTTILSFYEEYDSIMILTPYIFKIYLGTVLASDQFKNSIFRYDPINGSVKDIVYIPNEILGGMEFDHFGNNLYLSNIGEETIEVHSLTTAAKTIFYFGEQPYDIVLVPEEGYGV